MSNDPKEVALRIMGGALIQVSPSVQASFTYRTTYDCPFCGERQYLTYYSGDTHICSDCNATVKLIYSWRGSA
jgi:ribosomal protein L37AE/L43A